MLQAVSQDDEVCFGGYRERRGFDGVRDYLVVNVMRCILGHRRRLYRNQALSPRLPKKRCPGSSARANIENGTGYRTNQT